MMGKMIYLMGNSLFDEIAEALAARREDAMPSPWKTSARIAALSKRCSTRLTVPCRWRISARRTGAQGA
jgi:hypothetical protein